MGSEVIVGLVAAFAGSIAGWIASGLAVVNRVRAIEEAIVRIDVRLDNLIKESKR